ncbi:MAG: hypothetical protein NTY63_04900 [Candidatus Bipolaricaulota bacterium]|nr:hypothetical protein [Candidatus Bipolaricaulota bacterium]
MTQGRPEFPALDDDLRARIVRKTAETARDRYIFEDDAKAMADAPALRGGVAGAVLFLL